MQFSMAMEIGIIYDGVFSFLAPKDLVTVAKVSRSLRLAVLDYLGHAYSPHQLFSRFFDNVNAFRDLQAHTATLISGLGALDFFQRTSYLSDTLELYIHFIHRREVALWLVREGYQFLPSETQSQDLEYTITEGILDPSDGKKFGVTGMLLFSKGGRPKLKVRIIVATTCPTEVIFKSYSTCMINIITYEKAYCMFPRATLHERCSLRNHDVEGSYVHTETDLKEYKSRGITVEDEVDPTERTRSDSSSTYVLGWRWIDDAASWVIKLDTQQITTFPTTNEVSTPLRYDPAAISGFSLRYDITRKARIQFTLINGPTTKYSYAMGDSDLMEQLVNVVCYRCPLWDGKFYDGDFRDMCREILVGIVRFQDDVVARLIMM